MARQQKNNNNDLYQILYRRKCGPVCTFFSAFDSFQCHVTFIFVALVIVVFIIVFVARLHGNL